MLTEVAEGQVSHAMNPGALVTCRHASWGSPSSHGLPVGHFPCGRMYTHVAQATYVTRRMCNLSNTNISRFVTNKPSVKWQSSLHLRLWLLMCNLFNTNIRRFVTNKLTVKWQSLLHLRLWLLVKLEAFSAVYRNKKF